MDNLRFYESITDFYVYGTYYPSGTIVTVDSKNYCQVPNYITKIPFESMTRWKFKEINKSDIE